MLLLVIDTSGTSGGVLLARNETASLHAGATEVLGARLLQPRQCSTQLISGVAEILQSSQLELADLDAFAVVSGPGSFTGLRMGLSAVKAMAEVSAKPVMALSSLAILASKAAALPPGATSGETVHAVMDAGRGEMYHGVYKDAGRTCERESLQTLSGLVASFQAAPGLMVTSDATVAAALKSFHSVALDEVSVQDAIPLALAAWQASHFVDVAALDANYLRRINPATITGTAVDVASAPMP